MKYGTIKCPCGQEFYFETKRDSIHCIACNEFYDVSSYPEKEDAEALTDEPEDPEQPINTEST